MCVCNSRISRGIIYETYFNHVSLESSYIFTFDIFAAFFYSASHCNIHVCRGSALHD